MVYPQLDVINASLEFMPGEWCIGGPTQDAQELQGKEMLV